MELIWVLAIAVIYTIHITEAKSFRDKVLEEDIIQSDVTKTSNLSPYATNRRRSISLFPKMPHRENSFVINLNPTMKTERQTTIMEKYRKPFMKKLLIKDKDNVKVTTEVTTRRSLMHRKNFTVRPHDVYSKTIHKKDDWDSTNMHTHNLQNSKIEKEITKSQPDSDENSSEQETQNMNTGDRPINDHDIINIEKQHINNSDIGLESSKTLVLFPKRNNTNYLKAVTLPFGTDNKTASNDSSHNNSNSNVKIIKDKGKIRIAPKVSNKSHPIKQLEDIIEPKENNSDLERKDVYSKIIHKEHNSNNRNIDTHNLENSKSEKDITKSKPDSDENSSEEETQNMKTGDRPINDHDIINIEKQHINNSDIGLESSKTLVLFPKRNNTNYLKAVTLPFGTDNKTDSNDSSHNNSNSNVKIIKDKGKIRIAPKVSNKSHPIKQLEDIIEPKENNSDLERKDVYSEIIHKEDNSNNRNIDTHNLENSKSEKDITKFHPDSDENSSEEETQNMNTGYRPINDNDIINIEKQHINNSDIGLESSKTLVLFPKRNNTNYLKAVTLPFGTDNKTDSNDSSHNNSNSNVKIIKDKGKIRIAPKVSNKSHPIKQLEDIIEPKENNSDLERKDVYSEIIHKEDNSNNRNIDTHNLENSKSEKDITKFHPDSDENSSEEETQNMNTGYRPINDNDIINIEKQHINNSDIGLESSKTLVLFPKRNNTNYLKAVTIPFGTDNKTPSNDSSHNNSNSNVKIIKDKGKIRSAPKVSNKSHPIKQLEDIIEPKENNSDLERKDVYSKIIHKEHNSNNRNIDTHNLENSKSEKDITKSKPDSDENSSEEETQNMKTGDRPINDHDIINIEKQHINNSDIGLESSKTLVLFPKRNNRNYLKAVTIPFGTDNKTASNDSSHNNSNSDVKIIKDKGKIRSAPKVSNKSHSIEQLEEIIEPKKKDSDQERKDQNEFIYIKEVNKKRRSNATRDVDNHHEITISERFRFFSFRKNKLR